MLSPILRPRAALAVQPVRGTRRDRERGPRSPSRATGLGWPLAIIGLVLGAASAAWRLRRLRGEERLQLKLVLSVGAAVAAW